MGESSKARAYAELPEGYVSREKLDLSKNKRQATLVSVISLVMLAVMIALGLIISPFWRTFGGSAVSKLLKLLALIVGSIAYIVGHEAVHGLVMWRVSRAKPRFGFTLMYAYAGSDVYFAKRPYLLIALAPVVFWGFVFMLLTAVAPSDWFWVVYGLQTFNICGAAGDFYVYVRVGEMQDNVLIQDVGTSMEIFSPAAEDAADSLGAALEDGNASL